jgi:hypothetical protein
MRGKKRNGTKEKAPAAQHQKIFLSHFFPLSSVPLSFPLDINFAIEI